MGHNRLEGATVRFGHERAAEAGVTFVRRGNCGAQALQAPEMFVPRAGPSGGSRLANSRDCDAESSMWATRSEGPERTVDDFRDRLAARQGVERDRGRGLPGQDLHSHRRQSRRHVARTSASPCRTHRLRSNAGALPQDATGYIAHELDFLHLWAAFNERGVGEDEEVLVLWTKKNLKRSARLVAQFMPGLWVMVRPKDAYELMTDDDFKPELTGLARWEAISAVAEWKPDVMELSGLATRDGQTRPFCAAGVQAEVPRIAFNVAASASTGSVAYCSAPSRTSTSSPSTSLGTSRLLGSSSKPAPTDHVCSPP